MFYFSILVEKVTIKRCSFDRARSSCYAVLVLFSWRSPGVLRFRHAHSDQNLGLDPLDIASAALGVQEYFDDYD
jgi:hypothetical protein